MVGVGGEMVRVGSIMTTLVAAFVEKSRVPKSAVATAEVNPVVEKESGRV